MVSTVDIILLLLCAPLATAGPLRRRQGSVPGNPPRASEDVPPPVSATRPAAASLSSLLRFHQTATAFSTAPISTGPTGNAPAISSQPARNPQVPPTQPASSVQATPSERASNSQAGPSSSDQPRFGQPPDSSNHTFPDFGRHGDQHGHGTPSTDPPSSSEQPGFPHRPDSGNHTFPGFGGHSDQPGNSIPATTFPSRSEQPRFSQRPDSNNQTFPDFGRHGAQSASGMTTTTLTVTTTLFPGGPPNTSVAPTNFQKGSSQAASSSQPTPSSQAGGNRQPAQSEQAAPTSQPAPSTTFFVLGSSTLRVTVSLDHNGAVHPSGAAPSSNAAAPTSDSSTTTTITRMRTRFTTTTIAPDASSSSPSPASSSPATDGESRAVATRQSTTQTTFPNFSFAPTSAHTRSPSSRQDRTTVLPSIVTPSTSVIESSSPTGLPTSTSSVTQTQRPTRIKPSFRTSTTTSPTGMPGITIIPVNPSATTVYLTVTTTNAGVTTTVARETVTAQPCQGWHCWRQPGDSSSSRV